MQRLVLGSLGAGMLFLLVRFLFVVPAAAPHQALAAPCDSSFVLNWSNPATYSVTCGAINSAQWNVKGLFCSYYSPVMQVGGKTGDAPRTVDITLRINQSGNLDGNDTAWSYVYVNGTVVDKQTYLGNGQTAVTARNLSVTVPSGGNYRIRIDFINDKNTETWQLKDGDITTCLQSLPLPVNFLSFDGTASDQGNRLAWSTASEENNEYFTHESSTDGRRFGMLARVPGKGHSTQATEYAFLHEAAADPVIFYRLSQTDFDGTTRRLKTIRVERGRETAQAMHITVSPNPVVREFNVAFETDKAKEVTGRILSMDGEVAFSFHHQAQAGYNSVPCLVPQDLVRGIYLLQVIDEESNSDSARLIVIDR
jgi:hypothetical protein